MSLNVINLHLAPQSKKISFEQLRSTATTTTKLERLNRYSKERMIRADHSHREGFKHGTDGWFHPRRTGFFFSRKVD